MALLGTKIPSMEAGGKTLRSDPKKTTANPAHKIAEQSKITHGLATPESTPSLWTARLEVDKARREAEAAKASDVGTSDSPSGVNSVDVTVNKGKGPMRPSPTGGYKLPDPERQNLEQHRKKAVKPVFNCEPDAYHESLGVKDSCTPEETKEACD